LKESVWREEDWEWGSIVVVVVERGELGFGNEIDEEEEDDEKWPYEIQIARARSFFQFQ
jgi:hypothetical protein